MRINAYLICGPLDGTKQTAESESIPPVINHEQDGRWYQYRLRFAYPHTDGEHYAAYFLDQVLPIE